MIRDGLAGISVAGLLLPSAIAYAAIAGLSPNHAIVATIIGLGVYFLFGGSRFAMVAPTSSSAAILAALTASLQGNGAEPSTLAAVSVLATGLCFIVAGVARLGALANFISRPVLRGFTLGIAITIVVKQFPALAGIASPDGALPVFCWRVLRRTAEWQPLSLAIGTIALVALAALRRRPQLPGAAVVLAAGIVLARVTHLSGHVALIGALPKVSLSLYWPVLSMKAASTVLGLALPLFLILFAESWSSIRGLALLHGDKVNANRELLALGGANLVAGLARAMPVGAGFSASSAAEAAGARSRLTGLFAMGFMLVLTFWGHGLVALIPRPVLASVVVASLFHALDPAPLLRLWRIRRDQYVASAAVLAVIVLGVLDGMLIAIAFSVLALLQRFSQTRLSQLGRLPGTTDFVDMARHPEAETDRAILILRPTEPLFFANAERTLSLVADRAEGDGRVRTVVLSLEESPDLDSTSLDVLIDCRSRLERSGRQLLIARVKDHIRDAFSRAGAEELAGSATSFRSVIDAVRSAEMNPGNQTGS